MLPHPCLYLYINEWVSVSLNLVDRYCLAIFSACSEFSVQIEGVVTLTEMRSCQIVGWQTHRSTTTLSTYGWTQMASFMAKSS